MSRIDVHHHIQSPPFTAALSSASLPHPFPFSPSASRGLLSNNSIRAAILSHTAPGPEIERDPSKAAALAREFNDYLAGLRDEEASRYGFFASLPVAGMEACLGEVKRVFDELKADGVILFTSYSVPDGESGAQRTVYLGDSYFAPLWDALSARGAVVLVHPTWAPGMSAANPAAPVTMLDFPHETARTAVDLVLSNMLRDHARECRIILSHGGGTLGGLVDRVAIMTGKSEDEVREEFGWFYFDSALCLARQVQAVEGLVGGGRVLFGSDLPNAGEVVVGRCAGDVERCCGGEGGFGEEAARVLFPRFFK